MECLHSFRYKGSHRVLDSSPTYEFQPRITIKLTETLDSEPFYHVDTPRQLTFILLKTSAKKATPPDTISIRPTYTTYCPM